MGLSNRLQSIHAHGILFPHLHDLAKGALADDFEKLECFDGEWLGSGRPVVDLEME